MLDTAASNKFIVPIGPQHPALKEPGHFEFTVDGEIVTNAYVRLGYAHRGIEKAVEVSQLGAKPILARACMWHMLAYSCSGILPGS